MNMETGMLKMLIIKSNSWETCIHYVQTAFLSLKKEKQQ